MKTAERICAQGDVLFRRVLRVPDGFARNERAGRLVVAHSETGHHHAIDDLGVVEFVGASPLVCYLSLESTESAEVVHHRPHDTHETVCLGGGMGAIWEVRRQREWTPEGLRRAAD